MSREITHKAVTKFLPAQFPWIDVNIFEAILSIQRLIFNLTKYREVHIKYSLPIVHAGICWFEFDTSYGNN